MSKTLSAKLLSNLKETAHWSCVVHVEVLARVSERFRSRLYDMFEWRINDPEAYDWGDVSPADLKDLMDICFEPKNGFAIPFFGHQQPKTDFVYDLLEAACYFYSDIDLDGRGAGYDNNLNQWKETGFWTVKRPRKTLSPEAKAEAEALSKLKAEIVAEVQTAVKICTKVAKLKASPVRLDEKGRRRIDAMRVTSSFAASRTSSRGGVYNNLPGISLALDEFTQNKDVFLFTEYDHYASSKDIGNYQGPRNEVVAVLVAHEVAHALQSMAQIPGCHGAVFNDNRSLLKESHGEGFKEIYRFLRKETLKRIQK